MSNKTATAPTENAVKPTTFWCPRHDGFQFFFKERKGRVFYTAGGHERFERQERSKAEFKPELGEGKGGFYHTSDPEEIADLKTCPDVVVMD